MITEEKPVARWVGFRNRRSIIAYELGAKGAIWGGRAQYDVAVFYNDWTDILIPQILDNDPETGYSVRAARGCIDLTGGDATTYGIELSLFVLLTENWDINLGGSWTEAEYEDAATEKPPPVPEHVE